MTTGMAPFILFLSLAAPAPLPRAQLEPGTYRLWLDEEGFTLTLAANRTFRVEQGTKMLCWDGGEWEWTGRRLNLRWGRLDAGGLPPGVKAGFSKCHSADLAPDGQGGWQGKGWDDARQEWRRFRLRRMQP